MPFGSLSASQQVMVRLYMQGGPQYRAEMEKAGLVTRRLGDDTVRLGRAFQYAQRRSFLMNQALFTGRRFLFYTELGLLGVAGAAARMGFQYNNTMQQASVALSPVIRGTGELNAEMTKLFGLAAFTPFSFSQITEAFRIMYAGFQPVGIQISTINDLLKGTIDILSFTGQLTPMSLKRVSNAFQDMANIGKLTGITLTQLGRLGVPLRPILSKELGLTGDQLQHISDLGLDAQTVLQAVIHYARTTPGIMNAAFNQSQKTLFGAWSTFKDLVSQAAGQSESGIFGFVQRTLTGVNKQLEKFYKEGKPLTITNIVDAFDKQLSPRTHAISTLFVFFTGVVYGVAGSFYVLYRAVVVILTPFARIQDALGISGHTAKILGVAVGILTAVLITGKSVMIAYALAADAAKLALAGLGGVIKLTTKLTRANTAAQEAGIGVSLFKRVAAWALAEKMAKNYWDAASGKRVISRVFVNNGLVARGLRNIMLRFSLLKVALAGGGLRAALLAVAAASWSFTASLLANPITWIVVGVLALTIGLVILYKRWKPFRDLVNETVHWIKENWKWLRYFVALSGPIGLIVVAVVEVVRHFDDLVSILKKVWNLLTRIGRQFDRLKPPGWLGKVVSATTPVLSPATAAVSWLAHRWGGGMIPTTQPVIVGERGPEIASFRGGTNIIPYEKIKSRQSDKVGSLDRMSSGGGDDRPIVVQLVVDRQVLATAVARANDDYESRR